MQPPVLHTILGQTFWLSASRAIFWESKKTLIVSDLHLGKSGHFRKAGIAVPQQVLQEDMQRLVSLLQYFSPETVIVVGDFFHSTANREHDFFRRWRDDLSARIVLVRGNHDILKADWYREAGIEVVEDHLCIDSFCFSHDRFEVPEGLYTFSGHIHPGVVINGLGRQSLRFPCFFFTRDYCVLPAFGKFTGLANMQPAKEDVVYALVEQSVIRL
ncbi:MAG: metallophosphoesterase [Flaviaesturariibacter sp.]|nr:metallophosphoesterase [Flaviaesturariibacter sp.]